ncbi:hypothetical protein D3C73_897760 [compost metagenome]
MAGKGKGGKVSKKKVLSSGRPQFTMRIVDSSSCAVCKQTCARGLRYLDKMSEPGALGQGVPCILTRKRLV